VAGVDLPSTLEFESLSDCGMSSSSSSSSLSEGGTLSSWESAPSSTRALTGSEGDTAAKQRQDIKIQFGDLPYNTSTCPYLSEYLRKQGVHLEGRLYADDCSCCSPELLRKADEEALSYPTVL
jgi:hypothetical protein